MYLEDALRTNEKLPAGVELVIVKVLFKEKERKLGISLFSSLVTSYCNGPQVRLY